MIAFIEGILSEINENAIVLNVNGIGYEILTGNTQNLKLGTVYKFYTCVIYREDSQTLYGFETSAQCKLFKLLVEKVSGVGPKLALAMLTYFSMDALCKIIMLEDFVQLAHCPGVGKKTAQRLVLELKDHLRKKPITSELETLQLESSGQSHLTQEVVQTLTALGYSKKQAEQLWSSVAGQITSTDTTETALKKIFALQKS